MYKGKLHQLYNMTDDNPGSVVVLLGTAAQGPVMEPVRVAGPENASRLFGIDGTLPAGYRLAQLVNPQAVYCLMRINGSAASLSLNIETDGREPCLFLLEAEEANDRYNRVAVRVETSSYGDTVLVIKLDDNTRNVYNLVELPTLGELVDKINLDASLGYSPVKASTTDAMVPSVELAPLLSDWVYLEGGDSGLNPTKNELYFMLKNAYAKLEGLRTDIVVPLGVYFDDVLSSFVYGDSRSLFGAAWYSSDEDYLNLEDEGRRATFHGQLIDFCRRQFARGLMCHGVLGLRPMAEGELLARAGVNYIAARVGTSCLSSREGFLYGEDDWGHCISLVLGDLEYDWGYTSGAPAYAALIAAAGTETTTGMAVSNIKRQRTYLSNDPPDFALRYAADSGLVTFYNSIKKGLSVFSGVTAAPAGRPLHYLANVRTAHYLVYMLRLALEPYIDVIQGIIPVRDTIERITADVLENARRSGLIQSYSYGLQFQPLGAFSVVCVINLTIRAKYAVEDISITTNIAARV